MIALIILILIIIFIVGLFNINSSDDHYYKKDIPGKHHVIETLSDGSEKAVGWYIETHQLHYLLDHIPNTRAVPCSYKPKTKDK